MPLLRKVCESGGTVYLNRPESFKSREQTTEAALKVACKRWTCEICKGVNLWRFKKMVSNGCSILGASVFITLTYRKRPREAVRTVAYVNATWRRFLARWKYHNPEVEKTEWVRVTELTKRGQPHIHVILSWPCNTISMEIAKRIENEIRPIWRLVTRDSFVVHVVPVTSAPGAGAYLAKYLAKNMEDRDKLLWLGFKKRYSRSGGWPKLEYHLKGVLDKTHETWYTGPDKKVAKAYLEAAKTNSGMELAGDVVSMEMLAAHKRQQRMRKVAAL